MNKGARFGSTYTEYEKRPECQNQNCLKSGKNAGFANVNFLYTESITLTQSIAQSFI